MPDGAARPDHWDWLLSDGEHLLSWACESEPRMGLVAPSIQLPPHRLKYLDYEGAISGDRGTVRIWTGGTLDWLETGPDRFVARLESDRLQARVEWVRCQGQYFSLSVSPSGSDDSTDDSRND